MGQVILPFVFCIESLRKVNRIFMEAFVYFVKNMEAAKYCLDLRGSSTESL